MFPDMYFQYNHPTSKSQQKPFDKNRQNLIPLHPPQRRCHTPPTTHPPQRRCPSPPGTPQGNSAPAAIQRSADGPPPPGKPPHLTPKKTRTDRLPAGRLHGRDPAKRPHQARPCSRPAGRLSVRPSIRPSPTQKKSPQAQTPRNSPKTQISNYHQSLSVITSCHQPSPNAQPKLLNLLLTGNPLNLSPKTPELLLKILIPTLDINNIINNRNTLSS